MLTLTLILFGQVNLREIIRSHQSVDTTLAMLQNEMSDLLVCTQNEGSAPRVAGADAGGMVDDNPRGILSRYQITTFIDLLNKPIFDPTSKVSKGSISATCLRDASLMFFAKTRLYEILEDGAIYFIQDMTRKEDELPVCPRMTDNLKRKVVDEMKNMRNLDNVYKPFIESRHDLNFANVEAVKNVLQKLNIYEFLGDSTNPEIMKKIQFNEGVRSVREKFLEKYGYDAGGYVGADLMSVRWMIPSKYKDNIFTESNTVGPYPTSNFEARKFIDYIANDYGQNIEIQSGRVTQDTKIQVLDQFGLSKTFSFRGKDRAYLETNYIYVNLGLNIGLQKRVAGGIMFIRNYLMLDMINKMPISPSAKRRFFAIGTGHAFEWHIVQKKSPHGYVSSMFDTWARNKYFRNYDVYLFNNNDKKCYRNDEINALLRRYDTYLTTLTQRMCQKGFATDASSLLQLCLSSETSVLIETYFSVVK